MELIWISVSHSVEIQDFFHSDLKGIKFRQKPQLGKIDFKILMVEKS